MDLFLDHVSFEVDNIGRAKAFVESHLGFDLTLTPQQPDHHSRMRLDRWYIEVWKPEETTTASPNFPKGIGLYFLRAGNFGAFLQECHERNIPIKGPVEYVAADGSVWYDVEFDVPGIRDLLPFVVQPIRPKEFIKAWPVPLKEELPNALQTISSYYIATNRFDELITFYTILLNQQPSDWQENHFFETEQVVFNLSNGKIIICRQSPSILERTHLDPDGEGLFAVTLKSGDIEKTQRFFAQSSFEIAGDEFGNNWIMPFNSLKVFLGY